MATTTRFPIGITQFTQVFTEGVRIYTALATFNTAVTDAGTATRSRIARGAATILAIAFALGVPVASSIAVAAQPAAATRSAPAPTLSVGDRWVYRVTDRNGAQVSAPYEETREVTAIDADGTKVVITRSGGPKPGSRTELLAAPGEVRSGAACLDETRSFTTPLQRYAFPLEAGKRWNQWAPYVAEDGRKGRINYNVRVRGWEKAPAPGGSVDVLKMLVIVRYDDSDAFRNATECNFTVWYAPSLRGPLREERAGGYLSRGSSPVPTRLVDATYELASFTPGKP